MTDALHRGHLLTSRSRSTHSGHHRRGTQGKPRRRLLGAPTHSPLAGYQGGGVPRFTDSPLAGAGCSGRGRLRPTLHSPPSPATTPTLESTARQATPTAKLTTPLPKPHPFTKSHPLKKPRPVHQATPIHRATPCPPSQARQAPSHPPSHTHSPSPAPFTNQPRPLTNHARQQSPAHHTSPARSLSHVTPRPPMQPCPSCQATPHSQSHAPSGAAPLKGGWGRGAGRVVSVSVSFCARSSPGAEPAAIPRVSSADRPGHRRSWPGVEPSEHRGGTPRSPRENPRTSRSPSPP